jgi:hypothetical protein
MASRPEQSRVRRVGEIRAVASKSALQPTQGRWWQLFRTESHSLDDVLNIDPQNGNAVKHFSEFFFMRFRAKGPAIYLARARQTNGPMGRNYSKSSNKNTLQRCPNGFLKSLHGVGIRLAEWCGMRETLESSNLRAALFSQNDARAVRGFLCRIAGDPLVRL